jgi:pimeloyl-ACP methyl ester carboxylesterase
MSAIVLADEIVHYEVLGRGRPLILLHGWVGSWRYWLPSMQAASISSRAYAFDLWGFGDTAKNPSRYALEEQVALLGQFQSSLGIGKAALVGHGLGALVALQYALQNSGSVDRIMIIGLSLGNNHLSPRLRTASPQELADWLLLRSDGNEAARGEAPKTDVLAIQAPMANLHLINPLGLSPQINTPCLWIQGKNDPIADLPRLEQLAHMPEQSHHIVFEQSGHFPMLDEPTKFNRLLADFLTLDSGESPRQLQLKEEWKRRVR